MHSNLKSESISGDLNFENATGIHIRRDFDAKLKEIEEEVLLTIADASLDDYLELYDVGLNLIMEARSILEKQLSTSNDHLPYLIIISKITTLMVALRKMIHSGLPDAFKCIFRPLTESFDMFYVSLVDEEFRLSYANITEMYDNSEFWYKNARYERIKSKIHKMFTDASGTEDQFNYYNEKRKTQQKFLSESLHSSFNAAFATYFTPRINGDMDPPLNEYGNVTSAYPSMLLNVLEEVSIFNFVIYHVCSTKNISSNINIEAFLDNEAFKYHSVKYADLFDRYVPALNEIVNLIVGGYLKQQEILKNSTP